MEHVKYNGPPGTGKTQKLIEICNIEMRDGRQPNEIIFCSFTRAAAHEARNRAVQRFGGVPSQYPWFSTEHAICFRMLGLKREQVFTRRHLKEFGKRYNYNFSGDESEGNYGERYMESMLNTLADHLEFFISYMENKMLSLDGAYREVTHSTVTPDGFTKSSIEHYIERRTRYKQDNRIWSFGDMILGALQQGLSPEGAKVLILDEAQDSSKLLWELVKLWAGNVESYYVAGDPLQTLYFWSGSSPELFFDFPGEEEVLRQTHRFGPEIKDYAEKVVTPTGLPFPKFEPSPKHGVVNRVAFSSIDWHSVPQSFLLARTRWLISQLVDDFVKMGIPFISERGRQSPLATTKGQAFLTLLRLTDGEKVSDTELRNLIKFTRMPYLERGAKTRIKKLVEGMYGKTELRQMGFTSNFMDALYDNYTDILSQGFEGWEKSYLRRVYREGGRQAIEDEPRVRITTYHASKGREASHVFLCPDYTRTVWESFAREALPERLLMYVGCTRAKDALTILLPNLSDHFFPYPKVEGAI